MTHTLGENAPLLNGFATTSFCDGFYEGEWVKGKRHGTGKECFEDGTLSYEGEWKEGRRHGTGKCFRNDGTLRYEGEWAHDKPDRRATARKRKLERDVAAARARVVKAHLHHGDAFAYVPCGHRVVCGSCKESLDVRWCFQCLVCKEDSEGLMRVY